MNRRQAAIAALLLCLLSASPAVAATEQAESPSGEAPATPATAYSPTNLIVQWDGDADHGDKASAREEAEVSFDSDLGNRSFQLVEVEPGQSARGAIASLEANPSVTVVERDSYSAPQSLPNDPRLGELWGLRNLGAGVAGFSGAVAGDDVNAPLAWDRTVGLPSIVVADIDSGYRFDHPDLANVAWTNSAEANGTTGVDDDGDGIVDDVHGADFVGANGEVPTTDGNPTDDDMFSGGHGVHTAGTIGAQGNNGVGITGVAQNIRIMPLRVCSRFPSLKESRCPISSQIAAINYAAAKGARVANMSLGGNTFNQAEVNAIAAHPGILFVISAGNDGGNNDGGEAAPKGHHYPCDYRPQLDASPPVAGAIDNIICVAATDQADGLAGFSDWGPTSVDLGAPGTETLSTYPYVTPFTEDFSGGDFATKWPVTGINGGFQRTAEAPLTSFGMTDVVGSPVANTVRETTSAPIALPPNGGCKLNQTRRVVLSSGEQFRYSVLLNGEEKTENKPGSTVEPGLERRFLELPAVFNAGGSVQIRFRFTTGSAPSAGSGVWLDDVSLVCAQAIGEASAYGFLQGTSMAAPHVTGGAGLLFSADPAATVTQVRNALLDGVDAVPSLTGKTTSGGRLDIAKALDSLEGLTVDRTAPAAPALTSTSPPSPATETHPGIVGSAEAGSSIRIFSEASCHGSPVATGSAATLASTGIAVDAPVGATSTFSAAALDAARNASACSAPISYTNNGWIELESGEVQPQPIPIAEIAMEPNEGRVPSTPAPPPACTVPKLAGRTLAQAKAALTAAHCTVGKVTKPRAKAGKPLGALVVTASSPGAGAKSASGVVSLALGPKPKPHRRHR